MFLLHVATLKVYFDTIICLLGAGKTFTMLGTDQEPGIMARTLNDLFYEMDKTKDDMKYKVSMSYLEVSKSRVIFYQDSIWGEVQQ